MFTYFTIQLHIKFNKIIDYLFLRNLTFVKKLGYRDTAEERVDQTLFVGPKPCFVISSCRTLEEIKKNCAVEEIIGTNFWS